MKTLEWKQWSLTHFQARGTVNDQILGQQAVLNYSAPTLLVDIVFCVVYANGVNEHTLVDPFFTSGIEPSSVCCFTIGEN